MQPQLTMRERFTHTHMKSRLFNPRGQAVAIARSEHGEASGLDERIDAAMTHGDASEQTFYEADSNVKTQHQFRAHSSKAIEFRRKGCY